MEFDLEVEGGDKVGLLLALAVLVVVVGGVGFALLGTKWEDSRAAADRAAADLVQAEVDLVEAKTAASAQEQANWEHTFVLWTTALAAFRGDGVLLLLLFALAAGLGWLGRDLYGSRRQ